VTGAPDLVVTGATGRLGGRVARRLAAHGVPMRLLVRDPARAPDLPRTQVVSAGYGDAAAAQQALTGARTLFMVSAGESPDRVDVHGTFLDAAARAGVRHVVYVSFISAAPDSTFTLGRDHWHTEQHATASGMEVTFLRDNLYADFLPLTVGTDGVLRGPAGDGRIGAVTTDDIADAAAAVLLDPVPHVGATYGLTGPASLTLTEVTETMTRVYGRPVRFHDETVEEAYASRASLGAPDWQVQAWVSTYTGIAHGDFALVTDDVQRLTGHPATSFEDFLRASTTGSPSPGH
jgi:uncharacterized protein YbjT (DUF2867 family)